jgi:hypothetical protein
MIHSIRKTLELVLMTVFAFCPTPTFPQAAALDQPFSWDLSQTRTGLDLRPSGTSPFAIEGLSGAVEVNGKLLSVKDVRLLASTRKGTSVHLEYQLAGTDCRWTWNVVYRDNGLELTAILRNNGPAPVVLGKWDVVSFSGVPGQQWRVGEKSGEVRFFRWQPWDMRVETLDGDSGRHWSDNIFLLLEPAPGRHSCPPS